MSWDVSDEGDPHAARYRAAALDALIDARRLVGQARDELHAAGCHAARGEDDGLEREAEVLLAALAAEHAALSAVIERHRRR